MFVRLSRAVFVLGIALAAIGTPAAAADPAGYALLDKFVGFTEALNSLGDKLGQAQGAYEQALTRFQGNGGLLRQTEMLRELGVRSAKPVPEGFAKRVEQQSMLLPADPAARSPDLP